jgi:hypothetical protein
MGWEVKIPHTQTLNDNGDGGGCNNKKKHCNKNINDNSTFLVYVIPALLTTSNSLAPFYIIFSSNASDGFSIHQNTDMCGSSQMISVRPSG